MPCTLHSTHLLNTRPTPIQLDVTRPKYHCLTLLLSKKYITRARKDCKLCGSKCAATTAHEYCIYNLYIRFLLDYDGTLAAFNKTPQGFASPHRIHSILKQINQDSNNIIYVTSGRSKESLDEQLGSIPNIGLRCVSIEL